MDLYTRVAYANSRQLTLSYSTSFGITSRFFGKTIRPHIYAIYGLVRIADEIVDTYKGIDAPILLAELESATYLAIETGYSTNPIVHAFALTARHYGIDKHLIAPFFDSMRMDLQPQDYKPDNYASYIHGSAEVVGLMCLRVFCHDNPVKYEHLRDGAAALGAAYQKINFLRDMAADYKELGRLYFPNTTFDTFDDQAKQVIISDINNDLERAYSALRQLPPSSRKATMMSYVYYTDLLRRLEKTPAVVIKTKRIRLPSRRKLALMIKTIIREGPKK